MKPKENVSSRLKNIMPGTKKLWEEHLFLLEKLFFLPSVEKSNHFSSRNKSLPQNFSVPGILFPARRNIYFLLVNINRVSRLLEPSDLLNGVCFLCYRNNGYQVFEVDGERCQVLFVTIICGKGITRGRIKDWREYLFKYWPFNLIDTLDFLINEHCAFIHLFPREILRCAALFHSSEQYYDSPVRLFFFLKNTLSCALILY